MPPKKTAGTGLRPKMPTGLTRVLAATAGPRGRPRDPCDRTRERDSNGFLTDANVPEDVKSRILAKNAEFRSALDRYRRIWQLYVAKVNSVQTPPAGVEVNPPPSHTGWFPTKWGSVRSHGSDTKAPDDDWDTSAEASPNTEGIKKVVFEYLKHAVCGPKLESVVQFQLDAGGNTDEFIQRLDTLKNRLNTLSNRLDGDIATVDLFVDEAYDTIAREQRRQRGFVPPVVPGLRMPPGPTASPDTDSKDEDDGGTTTITAPAVRPTVVVPGPVPVPAPVPAPLPAQSVACAAY